ncbi:hypothetical protein [Streptacidiphilus sp. PAMC 29251]
MRARRLSRTYAQVGGALAVLLLVGACGGHSGPGADPTSSFVAATNPADPSVRSYNPPLKFSTASVPLPSSTGAVALVGTDAYVAGRAGLQVVDTRTGKVLVTVRPKAAVANAAGNSGAALPAPLVAAVGDSTLSLVLDAFPVTVAAQGSTPGGAGVELVAVDTSTRQAVWTTQLTDLPDWATDLGAGGLTADVVGFHGNTAVVTLTDGDHIGASFGIDLMSHRTVWHKDGFEAAAVAEDTVVGTAAANSSGSSGSSDSSDSSADAAGTERALVGLGLSDGSQKWKWKGQDTDAQVAIGPAGLGMVTVVNGSGGPSGFSYLVEADSGDKTPLPNTTQNAAGCRYDGVSMLLCNGQNSAGDHLYGLDAATGKQHWQIPDPASGATRLVPSLTAVWHGAAYGTTADGPLVLDARTGAARATVPGIAPTLVDGSVGLAPSAKSPLAAYPAVG